jgi:hypothetical protein
VAVRRVKIPAAVADAAEDDDDDDIGRGGRRNLKMQSRVLKMADNIYWSLTGLPCS